MYEEERYKGFTVEKYMIERERYIKGRGKLPKEEYCMMRYAMEQCQLMRIKLS